MAEKMYGVGSRIRAEWLQAAPIGKWSLSGMQMKLTASHRVVEGVISDIRGDDPINPSQIQLVVETATGQEFVDPKHVVAIL